MTPCATIRLQKGGEEMTPNEIAKHFNVTRRTVYRWIGRGCPHTKIDDGTLRPKFKMELTEVAKWRMEQWTKL